MSQIDDPRPTAEPVSTADEFTPDPADVELVAKVFITEARKNPVTPSPYSWGATSRLLLGPNEHDIARAVLSALAGAARLVPPDADTREQFGIKDSRREGIYPLRGRDRLDAAEEIAAADPDLSIMRRAVWVGPWLPATDTGETP